MILGFDEKAFSFAFETVRSGLLSPAASVRLSRDGEAVPVRPEGRATELSRETGYSFLGPERIVTFASEEGDLRLCWKVGSAGRDGLEAVFFRAAVTNRTDREVYLERIGLRSLPGGPPRLLQPRGQPRQGQRPDRNSRGIRDPGGRLPVCRYRREPRLSLRQRGGVERRGGKSFPGRPGVSRSPFLPGDRRGPDRS